MDYSNFRAQIGYINRCFGMHGAISTLLSFVEPITVGHHTFDTIDLQFIDLFECDSLGVSDNIVIQFPHNAVLPIKLSLESIGALNRMDIRPTHCPACGSELMHTYYETSLGSHKFGRCVNRNCSAQMYKHLNNLVAATGIDLSAPRLRYVLSHLLSRNIFSSPTDIFKLELGDYGGDITPPEACAFQERLHSIRGKVTVAEYLACLLLPTWDDTLIQNLSHHITSKHIRLSQVFNYLSTCRNLMTSDQWLGLTEFANLGSNVKFANELGLILEN